MFGYCNSVSVFAVISFSFCCLVGEAKQSQTIKKFGCTTQIHILRSNRSNIYTSYRGCKQRKRYKALASVN